MPSGFLGGGIGPVALKRRRAAAVASNGLLNNLIAYWPLNEAGGANNALDLHTNALTLTQNNSPGADTGKVYAGARTFNGSTQYFSRASEAALQTGDVDFTIAAWVYLAATTNYQSVITKIGVANSTREYQLTYTSTGTKLIFDWWLDTIGNAASVASGAISQNGWHLVECYHNAADDLIGIALDGGAFATAAANGGNAGTAAMQIGSRELAGPLFSGRIGPVAMWKSAPGGGGVLSEAQRTALWNDGAGLAYADFTA